MYSKHILFEEIVEGVKDDTGIENLRNLYPKIRRLIYRCEQDIGFGGSTILKRITYSIANGTIIKSNGTIKIKLPEDMIKVEAFGMCQEGICPGDYKIQGNYLFLCKDVEKFSLVYYSLLCDGEGNPMVTQNHKEAVISGISQYLYKPRLWMNKSGASQSHFQTLERYYHDRIGEARGDDAMPSTKEEWSAIAKQLRMSASQTLMYNNRESCYCCIEDVTVVVSKKNSAIKWWQFNDRVSDISLVNTFDENYLNNKNEISLDNFYLGNNFEYNNIGRIAFAMLNTTLNKHKIVDIFDNDITEEVFDTYFDENNNTQFYISKEYYSNGSIYFKLKNS